MAGCRRSILAVTLSTPDGTQFRAGASTGTREAVQLRDGDQQRYAGEGVRQVVGHFNGEIARALVGRPFASAAEVDAALSALDGTDIKSRLGVNAIIGVSLAGRGTRYRTPS